MRGDEIKSNRMKVLFTVLFTICTLTTFAQVDYNEYQDTLKPAKPAYYLSCLELGYDYDGLGAVFRYKFCNNTSKAIVNYGLVIYAYDAWGKPVNAPFSNNNRYTVKSQDCKIDAYSCGMYPCNGELLFALDNHVSKIKIVITKIKLANGKVIMLPVHKKYVYWVNAGNREIECEE